MKRIYLILFSLVLIFLLPCPAFADGFEHLRADAANIKTVQADFVQKKIMKILSRPLVSEGKFFYEAPDSFRWEYLKPLKSVVLSNKGEARRFIMSQGKMVEDNSGGVRAVRIVLDEVINWTGGRFDQNPAFKAYLKEGETTLITLVPVEQNMAGMIEKIEITVIKKSKAIKSVRIIENDNAATVIDFSNVEINKAINASVFRDVE